MKNEKDKELDDLFNRTLVNPVNETGYREDDWDALEKMLNKRDKRPGIIFWLPVLSTAAAVLIFFGWLFFKQPTITHNQEEQAVIMNNNNHENNQLTKHDATKKQINIAKNHPSTGLAKSDAQTKHAVIEHNAVASNKQSSANYVAVNSKHALKPTPVYITPAVKNVETINRQKAYDVNYPNPNITLIAVRSDVNIDGLAKSNLEVNALVVKGDIIGNHVYRPAPQSADDNNNTTSRFGLAKHPQLTLSFVGAPEINTVNSVGGSKAGSNFGLLFSAGVFNKLTITTGATYSTKPYSTDISNYHTNYTFKYGSPTSIEADCRLLDIPVNVDYQLYNRHNNKFSIGSGLSSYIMLHESYDYYYANPGTAGPQGFTVKGNGKYFFGIANLQATYTRQINSKVGISIQPYMKLPISNIGYSQARLQTTGVAIGLSWKLNSLTKP